MKLFLLRHGDAMMRSTTGKDFDRQLSPLGIQQAQWVNNSLRAVASNHSLTIFCSAAQRTRETAQHALTHLKKKAQFFEELYHASAQQLLTFLQTQSPVEDAVLLIGHNNGISDLATYFLEEQIHLSTCGLIVIDFPEVDNFNAVGKGTGIKEEWILAPKEIES